MENRKITQAELDNLERNADKIFGNLGLDIEFTRHFLDRVNDERNRKQITIKELAELLVKEYKRWGRDIARMPNDAEAVMRDLSSNINVPFALDWDERNREMDLVAKTVMRKPDFRTRDRQLPVESVSEDEDPCWDGYRQLGMKKKNGKKVPNCVPENVNEAGGKIACLKCDEVSTAAAWKKTGGTCPKCKKSSQGVAESETHGAKKGTQIKETKLTDAIPALEQELNSGAGFDRKVFQLEMAKRSRAPGPWGFGSAGGGIIIRWMTHGAKTLAEERGVDVKEVTNEARQYIKQWLQQNTKPITVRDRDSGETKKFYIKGNLAFDDNVYYVRVNTKRMLQNKNRFEIQEGHVKTKKTKQVKGSSPMPKKSKPSRGGETPHPYRGQLVGASKKHDKKMVEAEYSQNARNHAQKQEVMTAVRELRNQGWNVYVSRQSHRRERDFLIELEKGNYEAKIIGQGNYWEAFTDGDTVSGRGEDFSNLEFAIRYVTQNARMFETMDQGPLDVKTLTPREIADHHGVDIRKILHQLKMGIRVEMEHTSDRAVAREIALDHLLEMPDYYTELSDMEGSEHPDVFENKKPRKKKSR